MSRRELTNSSSSGLGSNGLRDGDEKRSSSGDSCRGGEAYLRGGEDSRRGEVCLP